MLAWAHFIGDMPMRRIRFQAGGNVLTLLDRAIAHHESLPRSQN